MTLSLVKTGLSDFKCLLLHSGATTFIMGAAEVLLQPLEVDAKTREPSVGWDSEGNRQPLRSKV